jgi:hypothetical protein
MICSFGVDWLLRGRDGQLSCSRGPRVVDPEFCGDELESEANPEGRAEELTGFGRVTTKNRYGEKGAHDRADGGDGKTNGVTANHPFAVLSELAMDRMPESFSEREQKKVAEEYDGGLLVDAANGFPEGHGQAGNADDGAGCQKNAARPAVKLRMFRADAADELQRSQDHEECGGQNVSQSESTMIREVGVQSGGGVVPGCERAWMQKHDGTPRDHRQANEGEENHGEPEESYECAIQLHNLNGLLEGIRRGARIYIRRGDREHKSGSTAAALQRVEARRAAGLRRSRWGREMWQNGDSTGRQFA